MDAPAERLIVPAVDDAGPVEDVADKDRLALAEPALVALAVLQIVWQAIARPS